MPGTATESDSDGYRRDNWFGEDEYEIADRDHSDHGSPDKDELLAHAILRECAPKLCGRSVDELAADDSQERIVLEVPPDSLQLTEPELHIPKSGSDTFGTRDYGQFRHRRRFNEKTGRISSGESTWVKLGLVDHDTLMGCVEVAIRIFDPPPSTAEDARERANELKRNPQGPVDKDIMSDVIGILRP